MDFLDFCRLHGVVIDRLPAPGRWVRLKTVDKPRHRNGAVKWMGDFGLCQNWATQTEVATWHAEGPSKAVAQTAQHTANQAAAEARVNAQKAAQRAAAILAECELAPHPYLASKGFPDEMVNVWNKDADNVMVVPMRCGTAIVGAQLIKPDGDKKFLYGQRSGGAEFVIGQKGSHVLCEGYATALSAQQALRNLKVPYTLHIAFSAGNMKRIAETLPGGIVVADNDASLTGERVAKEIGWPYWLSDDVGEDFNDACRRLGLFAVSMQLKRVLAATCRKAA